MSSVNLMEKSYQWDGLRAAIQFKKILHILYTAWLPTRPDVHASLTF
jgi:hypothetical protein